MRKIKTSLIFNFLIFVLVTFSTIAMLTGFQFMSGVRIFLENSYLAFKYFTVDSNVFAGIASLILGVYELLLIKKKITKIPTAIYVLKFAASVSLTLTMMVTACFLAPTAKTGYFSLFMDSNLFFHFITPVLCIISFIFFENGENISFKHTFTAISPMGIYAVYYLGEILIHLENGVVAKGTDWYGFLVLGFNTIYFVLPLILIITYIFSLVTWFFYKKK